MKNSDFGTAHEYARFQISDFKFEIWHLMFAFLLLGLIYTVSVPVFEAPDEPWHFNYVRYVAQGHGLPSMLNNDSGAYQEVGQPPLYYLIAGLVTAPISTDDLRGLTLHNPGFGYQAPGTVNDNKNLMAHTEREAFPWRGAVLAIHLARLVSLAFGALAVLVAWALAREVFADSDLIPLATAAVVAFTPQFVFASSVTSNDSSAAALSTAALWAIARMMKLGVTSRRAALAGLFVGLASLTKTSTILLGVFAAAAILMASNSVIPRPEGPKNLVDAKQGPSAAHLRRTAGEPQVQVLRLSVTWKTRLRDAVVLTGIALVVGGWWYARNGLLYGDPLGLGVHLNTPWARLTQISIAAVLPSLPLAYRSFWGAFGWGNVEMSAWIYAAIGVTLVASVVGWMLGFRTPALALRFARRSAGASVSDFGFWGVDRGKSPTAIRNPHASYKILLMCALWCGAVFVSFLNWNQQVEAPHGRLLFPVLGALALLLVAGWARLPRPHVVLGVVVVGFLVLSSAAPFAYIRPAYAWPELFPPDQLAGRRLQVASHNLQYGDEARLIGVGLDRTSAAPGEWLNVTLCWTAAQPITRNLTVFVHLLGRENLVVGARNTWPGLGRFPTSLWPAGRAFCDIIPVFVETTAPVPELYGIEAGLYDAKTNDRLEAVNAAGQLVLPPIVGRVRIAPAQPLRVSPEQVTQADFGSAMLIGFDVAGQARSGERIPLKLYWRATATLPHDYTVFVHLLDGAGQPVAQADAEPRGSGYPTSAWVAGDVIPDDHTLNLPANLAPGDYVLRVGLYLAPNGPRLQLKPSGDAFTLGVLRVTR